MKRLVWQLLAGGAFFVTTGAVALADSGAAPPTLSFFSGGDGAHANWLVTTDQPLGDTENQAIELQTTNDAPTFAKGYAGVLIHHVTGIPAATFPDSEFWVKTPTFTGSSSGSPRLVVEFQDAAGNFVGYGDLRPNALTSSWQDVSDQHNYPSTAWDVMGGPCGFVYNTTWPMVQSCLANDTTLSVFLTADPYGIYHLIDDITVDGKTFTSASDNGNGKNDPAGPTATADPTLLPPLIFPPL